MFDVSVLLHFLDIYFVQNENCYSNNTVFNENIIDDSPSKEPIILREAVLLLMDNGYNQ